LVPLSIAGLPRSNACVALGPPLSSSGPSSGSSVTVSTGGGAFAAMIRLRAPLIPPAPTPTSASTDAAVLRAVIVLCVNSDPLVIPPIAPAFSTELKAIVLLYRDATPLMSLAPPSATVAVLLEIVLLTMRNDFAADTPARSVAVL